MTSTDLEALESAARRAFDAGRLPEAIVHYRQLELRDGDPEWARRAAQAYNLLGDHAGEIEALDRAARGYQARGDVLRAAVTSKLILAIDPDHGPTRRRIPELIARRDAELGPPRPATIPPPPPTPQAAQRIAEAIHDFYFRELVDRPSQPVPPPMPSPGMHRIPLAGDHDGDFEIVVEEPVEEPQASIVRGEPIEGAVSPIAADALRSALFSDLSPRTFNALVMSAHVRELEDGEVLFRQGDVGQELFVIVSGTVGVIDEGPPRRGITKLGERAVFGEIALFTDQPRTATVAALGPVQVIAIDRAVVSALSAQDPRFLSALLRFVRDRLVDRLLATNPLFTALSERDRAALKPRFQLLEVDEGALLIEQDKVGEQLLILLAGRAEVVREQDGEVRPVGELSPGDVAGEISLLTQRPAIATVRALTRALVVSLPAAVFHTIVRARPEAMRFVQRLAEQRMAQSRAIMAGDGDAPPAS